MQPPLAGEHAPAGTILTTGRELRPAPTRITKDGTFLDELVAAGLLAVAEKPGEPGPGRRYEPAQFRARYRLADLGRHAAEYGEYDRPHTAKADYLGPILAGAARASLPFAIVDSARRGATGGFYSELRGRGESKFTAGLGALGGGLMDFVSSPLKDLGLINKTYGEAFRARHPRAQKAYDDPSLTGGDGKDRRMTTIADAGFDAPGSAFERMTTGLALVTAQKEEEGEKGLLGIMTEVRDAVKALVGLQTSATTRSLMPRL